MTSTRVRHPGGRTCRQVLTTALLTIAGAVALAGMGGLAYAKGATIHSAVPVATVTCTETWTPWVTPSNNQAGASWDANTCEHYIRGDVRCVQTVGGSSTHAYGGWINETLNLISWATCPGSFPIMTDGYAQFKNCATCAISTVHFWPSSRRE